MDNNHEWIYPRILILIILLISSFSAPAKNIEEVIISDSLFVKCIDFCMRSHPNDFGDVNVISFFFSKYEDEGHVMINNVDITDVQMIDFNFSTRINDKIFLLSKNSPPSIITKSKELKKVNIDLNRYKPTGYVFLMEYIPSMKYRVVLNGTYQSTNPQDIWRKEIPL